VNCSVCGTEKQPDSDYCPKCGIDAWVDPALVKLLEENQEGTYGFDYPEYSYDEAAASAAGRRRGWLKWSSIALVTALVTFAGISIYNSVLSNKPASSQAPTSMALPTFEEAFPPSLLSSELSPLCANLQASIDNGISAESLQTRINAASTATQSVKKAKAFVSANEWVAQVSGPEAWLDSVSSTVSSQLSGLAAKSGNAAVKAASQPDLAAAYQSSLQSAWLAECGLSGDFAAKKANLMSYQRVATSVLARATEPEPTETSVAAGNDDQNQQATTPPIGTWPPSGLKKVAGFADFAYKPINDFCSVGEVCAKFKLASKSGCASGANLWIHFVDANGRILDTYKDVVSVSASSSITVEANTEVSGVTGWDISNLSCR
jgi:hypothetical protein